MVKKKQLLLDFNLKLININRSCPIDLLSKWKKELTSMYHYVQVYVFQHS